MKHLEITLQVDVELARIGCLEQNTFVATKLITMHAKYVVHVKVEDMFDLTSSRKRV